MSSTYSEDEFELTAGSLSAVSSNTAGPNTRESYDDEREDATSRLTVVLPKESVGDDDDNVDVSEAGYSSFEDDDAASLPATSPSFTVGERDGRTSKQVLCMFLLAGVGEPKLVDI